MRVATSGKTPRKRKPRGGRPARDFLEPIISKIKRKRFLVYDIESKSEDTQSPGFTRPFLVGLFDPSKVKEPNEGYQEFRDEPHLRSRPWQTRHILPGGCMDKLLSVILTKEYSGCAFYAHNGGNFDHLFALTWLQEHRFPRGEYDFEVVPVQSSIITIRVWRVPEDPEEPIKDRWEFLDSMKLMPMGLDKACKTFGLPGKVEFNLSTHEDDAHWGIYLKQDCVALATVLTLFHNMVERLGGEVGVTTPSTAMKLFRRKFIGKNGCPEKIHRWAHWKGCSGQKSGTCLGCAHDWIRLGYYGGRTEIFRLIGLLLHYYDLNSSYVASMRNLMPIGDRIVEEGQIDWRRHHSPKNPKGRYGGFAEVTVYVPPDCAVPPLPHRDKKSGRLMFPAGQFHGVWSLEELELLEDPFVGGRIVHVVKTVWFKLKPMFREMVDELWKLRDPKLPGYDEGLSALAKLLGNSTYGKFAMKQQRSSVVFTKTDPKEGHCFLCPEPDPDYEGDPTVQSLCPSCEGSKPAMKDPDGDVWYQAHTVDAPYIIPHVASHITALSRIALWRYMKMAVQKGGQIYYTDTDSILTDVTLPTSSLLGELKDEYPGELLSYMAVQPKVYVIEKMNLNDKIRVRRELLSLAMSGDESVDASALDVSTREPWPGEADEGKTISSAAYVLEPHSKVTMKGFPSNMRTKANLLHLKGEKVTPLRHFMKPGRTLEWTQLEKVRSMAREGFRRPPKMRVVQKSFKTTYDKRIVLKDGISTRSAVLDEPVGGYVDGDNLAEAAE